MNRVELLQNAVMLASELEEAKAAPAGKVWKLNYPLLINPKIKCPYCWEWVESGRVWVLDEDSKRVKRVWLMDGTQVNLSAERCHPHVDRGGSVCMGSSESVQQVIVASVTPGETYEDVKAHWWFAQKLGHECEPMKEGRWKDHTGQERTDANAAEAYGNEVESDEDHEGESFCEGCDDWYDESETSFCEVDSVSYCESCWAEKHESCDDCSETIHTHSLYGRSYSATDNRGDRVTVCESCYSDNYFCCEVCDDDFHTDLYHGDGICTDCWEETHARCRDCDEWLEKEKLDEHELCEECRPELTLVCSECETNTAELFDGKCRACFYGTGEGQISLLEEVAND